MNFAAKIAELNEQLATLQGAHATLQGAHKATNEQLVTANATIAELKPKAEQTTSAIAAAVVTQIASAGVPPIAKVENPEGDKLSMSREEWRALPPKAQRKFLNDGGNLND